MDDSSLFLNICLKKFSQISSNWVDRKKKHFFCWSELAQNKLDLPDMNKKTKFELG